MTDILLKSVFVAFKGSKRQNIAIQDSNIVEIGSDASLPAPEYTITGKNLLVTPALFNSHTHLPMTLLRGYSDDLQLFPWLQKVWKLEKHFSAESCAVGAELAFLEMIKGGTGGFVDFYFHEDHILEPAARSGLRGILGCGVIEGTFLEQGGAAWMLKVAEGLARKLDGSDSLIKVAVAPHAPHTCSKETIQRCLDLADKFSLPITIHLSETREDVINMQKKKGVPPIEWLDQEFNFFKERNVLAVHCVWIQQREIEILAAQNAAMAYCPVSAQKLAYGGLPPVPELLRAGVSVCLGTDGSASNNTLDMVREMREGLNFVSANRWNPALLSSGQMLEMASMTFRSRFFKQTALTPGSVADLSIFAFGKPHTWPIHNPISTLVYSANGSDAHSLIVNGNPLLLSGELQTINEEATLERASNELEKIKQRAIEAGDYEQDY
ncbi:MAG TPA: amidohydrolase [Candidatus Hodarchaeales archaeon]|nr:amidohydrolase [Candidatus Hodarchaeales archaeon]